MDRRLALIAAALLAATGARGDEAAAPPRVAGVELRLPPGEDAAAAASLIGISPGDPLSARTVRRAVQRLYLGGRYRNVEVREAPAEPPPGARGRWVRLVVEALPIRVLGELAVRVEGPSPLDAAALRAAAGLEAGAPFDESDLDGAASRVHAALVRRGFRDARVQGRVVSANPVVAELAVAAGAPLVVEAVRLAGAAGPDAGALAQLLATRAGAPLEDEALEADVRRLRGALHAAGHRRARVQPAVVRVSGHRAEVEFPVDAGPRIRFAFRGNQEVPSAALARELGFEEGVPVDLPAVGAAADRLAAYYRARGHAAVRVDVEEVRRGRDLLVIVFHVDEGRRYRVAAVHVEGIAFRDERWVRERLAAYLDEDAPEDASSPDVDAARALEASFPGARAPLVAPDALLPHAALDDAAWDRAAERLVDAWRGEGFLEALYLGASVTLDARTGAAEVTLRFREGRRTHVESIGFEGNEAVGLAELAREARLAPGDPLVFERVEDTRAAMLRVYLARGHLYARVEARETVDRERHVAALRFVVDEGPLVRVGRIVLSGNRRTRDSVVRGAITVEEGKVYEPDRVAKSQAQLLRLGVFRAVALRLQDPELPQEVKDLSVDVAERPWLTLSPGAGFSIANGPRAFLELVQPNLFGRALELIATGKVNYPLTEFRPDLAKKAPADRVEGRADVGLRSPGLLLGAIPTRARTDLIGEILHRKAYDLRRATGVAGLDFGLTSRISFSLQYELEVDQIAKSSSVMFLTQADVERLRFDEGVTTLHAFRPSFTLDYRDNSAHPHSGWFLTGAVEWARSLGGPSQRLWWGMLPGSDIHTNLLKLSGTATGYVPLSAGTVLALSVRGGRVFPQDGRSRTVIPRRFFLGGANTMRGYGEEELIQQDVRDQLHGESRLCATTLTGVGCTARGRAIAEGGRPVSEGGEAFVLGKAELRQRIRGNVEGAVFVDAGNLWLDPEKVRFIDLRANAGFGLRFVTPIGPAALDLGFNLAPDDQLNERVFAPHFTIGLF